MLASLTRRKASLSLSSIGATHSDLPSWVRDALSGKLIGTSSVGNREDIEANFDSMVRRAYKANGPVFTAILVRALALSEARFQFQQMRGGRPGRLFGDQSLSILETPWANATTGELIWRMEQDGSLAGNFYCTTIGNGTGRRIRRMRPDWVTIVTGVVGDPEASPFDLDAEVLGYIYEPKGVASPPAPVLLTAGQVVHYSPIPDPEAQWRGMSWLQPIVNEISADDAATRHKLKFFENGATSNLVITYDPTVKPEAVTRYAALFGEQHQGVDKAYKAIHLGGGADAKTLGADLKQIDFRETQGAGETRIAAVSGVGAIIARFSEGMQGSSLNAGNYAAAKRQIADMTLRPLWRTMAGSLAKIAPAPPDARLWYDTRDIEFLKDDRKDQTAILQQSAQTIRALVDAGYAPDAVIDAVEAGDLSRLTGQHSGLYSVQLQAPGSAANKATPADQLKLDLAP